jgi:hypothetical protein
MRNYFAAPWVGARYARGRPDVHTAIAASIGRQVAPGRLLERALVAFLSTQSSPIAAVEAGLTSVAALEAPLQDGLARLFPDGPGGAAEPIALRFSGPVFYLRPV